MLDGEVISTIPLETESDIDIDATAYYLEKVQQVMSNPLFTWICVLIGLELVMLIVSHYVKASYRRKIAEPSQTHQHEFTQKVKEEIT